MACAAAPRAAGYQHRQLLVVGLPAGVAARRLPAQIHLVAAPAATPSTTAARSPGDSWRANARCNVRNGGTGWPFAVRARHNAATLPASPRSPGGLPVSSYCARSPAAAAPDAHRHTVRSLTESAAATAATSPRRSRPLARCARSRCTSTARAAGSTWLTGPPTRAAAGPHGRSRQPAIEPVLFSAR